MKAWPLAVSVLSISAVAASSHAGGVRDDLDAFDAVLRPARTVSVSAATVGLLETVEVERGDRVTREQVLARLDSEVELADVRLLQARAESDVAVRVAELRLQRRTAQFEQAARLAEDAVMSAEELEQYRTERDLAELEVLGAREEARTAELELQRARARLEQRTVRSPLDGVVVERWLSAGEMVGRTQDDVIVEIAQLHPLHVDVRVPQSMLRSLQPGARARVELEEPIGEALDCVVTLVDPILDAASGSLRVRLEVPNPEFRIPAGLRCRVRFLE